VFHSLHLSHDEKSLYFIEDTVLYQLDTATGALLNSLEFDSTALEGFFGLDVSPDDLHVAVIGSTSNPSTAEAFWAEVEVATFLASNENTLSGFDGIDVKYVSNTDFIIVLSTDADAPYTETY
jgi:hypothetical protein